MPIARTELEETGTPTRIYLTNGSRPRWWDCRIDAHPYELLYEMGRDGSRQFIWCGLCGEVMEREVAG